MVTVLSESSSPDVTGTCIVEEGDTLQSIAERLDVSVESLAEANGLDSASELEPGLELVVPFRLALGVGGHSDQFELVAPVEGWLEGQNLAECPQQVTEGISEPATMGIAEAQDHFETRPPNDGWLQGIDFAACPHEPRTEQQEPGATDFSCGITKRAEVAESLAGQLESVNQGEELKQQLETEMPDLLSKKGQAKNDAEAAIAEKIQGRLAQIATRLDAMGIKVEWLAEDQAECILLSQELLELRQTLASNPDPVNSNWIPLLMNVSTEIQKTLVLVRRDVE